MPKKSNDATNASATPSEKPPEAGSFAGELIHSAAYSGVQKPIQGLAQIADNTLGSKILPAVEFMNAPKEAAFNSSQWYAQTIGNGFGSLLPFLVTHKVLFGSSARGELAAETKAGLQQAGKAEIAKAASSGIGLSLKESAVVGFTNDFLMRPVEGANKDEVSKNFWTKRAAGGLEGAISFTTLTAGSLTLGKLSMTSGLKNHIVGAAIRNPVIGGVISGIPAGTLGATFEGARTGDFSAQAYGKSIYSMMVSGGVLGAKAEFANQIKERRTKAQQSSESPQSESQENSAKPRGKTASEGPLTLTDHYNENAQKVTAFLDRQYKDVLRVYGKPQTRLGLLFEGQKEILSKSDFYESRFNHWDDYGMHRMMRDPEPTKGQKALYDQALPASQALLKQLTTTGRDNPTSPITSQEANAYMTLRHKSPQEAEALEKILTAGSEENKLVLKELKGEFVVHDEKSVASLNQQARQTIADRNIWQGLKETGAPIDLEAAQAIKRLIDKRELGHDPEQIVGWLSAGGRQAQFVGRSIFETYRYKQDQPQLTEKEFATLSERGKGLASAFEVFEALKAESPAPEAVAPKPETIEQDTNAAHQADNIAQTAAATPRADKITLEEANAYGNLRNEQYWTESHELEQILKARGPASGHVINKISHDVEHQYYRNLPFEIKEDPFSGLMQQAERLAQANRLYEHLAKSPPETKGPPYITTEEASAIYSLDHDQFHPGFGSRKESEKLTSVLAKRGIEAEVMAKMLTTYGRPHTSEADLQRLAQEAEPAIKLLQRTTSPAEAARQPISLQDAEGLRTLQRLGMKERVEEIGKLYTDEQPYTVKYLVDQLQKTQEPITQEKLDSTLEQGRTYNKARQVLDGVIQAERKEVSGEGRVTPQEVEAYLAFNKLQTQTEQHQLMSLLRGRNPNNETVLWLFERREMPISEQTINRAYLLPEFSKELEEINKTLPAGLSLEGTTAIIQGGATSPEALQNFAYVWKNVKQREGVRTTLDADPALIGQFSENPMLRNLPEEAIGPVFSHFQKTGTDIAGSHDAASLTRAAKVWQFEPTVPLEIAEQFGDRNSKDCIKAALAWLEVKGSGDTSQFQSKFEEMKTLGASTAVARLTSADALVPAISALHRDLSPEARKSLGLALSSNQEALPLVASLKAAHFEAAFKALTEPSTEQAPVRVTRSIAEGEEKLSLKARLSERVVEWLQKPKGERQSLVLGGLHHVLQKYLPSTWQNKLERALAPQQENAADQQAPAAARPMSEQQIGHGALGLALTFKGGSQQWLNTQRALGRTDHDAVYWLPNKNPQELIGLGQVLMSKSFKQTNRHEMLANRWAEVPEDIRKQGYDSSVEFLKQQTYENIKSPPFASEAAEWGISKENYAKYEARFVASQNIPMPFPVNKSWSDGGLTGRFIPRSDARGLFLGQHTNSCQHPDGAAQTSAWYGQESPKSGFFVVENKNGEIVAESWAWISDKGGLTFDNVEAKGIGKRDQSVRNIYKSAADYLSNTYHTITMGTGHSDLDVGKFAAAGDKTQNLPSDYSGYTDATGQVLLAYNPAVELKAALPERIKVRGAVLTDKDALEAIAKEVYPKDWQFIQIEPETRGLVLEKDNNVVGYALYEPESRYVSDLAVKPGTKPSETYRLLSPLFKVMSEHPGSWAADCRESTSYQFIKALEKRGRIKITEDQVNGYIGGEPRRHVVFDIVGSGGADIAPEADVAAAN